MPVSVLQAPSEPGFLWAHDQQLPAGLGCGSVLSCRRVPAGDTTDQPGRLGGPLPGPGIQRTPPGDRQPGGQGDPQLRPRRQGRPRGARPAGRLHLPLPRTGAGGGRGRRDRGGDPRLPPAGRGLDAGPALGTPGHRRGHPPCRRRPSTRRRAGGAVIFALVAQRALEPGSKLAATGWIAERVAIEGCAGFSDDAAYAAMDFLLDALAEVAAEIFASVAHLLNLDLDIVFVDTTSPYFETEAVEDQVELAEPVI